MKQVVVIIWTLVAIFTVYAGYLFVKKCPQGFSISQYVFQPKKPDQTDNKIAQVNESNKRIMWGAYTQGNLSSIAEFENKIGTKMDMVATFVLWGGENYFPTELAENIKANGQSLVIYWESQDPKSRNLNDKKYSYDAILNGDWDEYITNFGESIRESGTQVILTPFIEMNGNWYPWSITKNGNSAEKHKLAFRKIHDMLGDIPNLKFGWVVNNGSVPDSVENSIAGLYPGDEYVDYVGVDGFNFGNPWQSPTEVFDKSLTELKNFKKPIMIFSTASAEGDGKAQWIEDFGNQLIAHPEIKAFIWFNEDKERDWRVWSDESSVEAFQNIINTKM